MRILLSNKYVRDSFIVLALVVAGIFSYFRVFELYELQTYDWRCQIRGPRPVSDKIAVIEIGDDVLRNLGWPVDRKYHAQVIDYLKKCGARVVAFDMIIPNPLPVPDPSVKVHPSDAAVIEAVKAAGNVYFGFVFPPYHNIHGRYLVDVLRGQMRQGVFPFWRYTKASKGIGYVNTTVDIDGKRRRIIPVFFYHGENYYQLSLKIARDLLNENKSKQPAYRPAGYLQLSPSVRIPLDEEDGCMFVNYARTWKDIGNMKGFRHYSYYDILKPFLVQPGARNPSARIDPKELKGKICFIGLTAIASTDINPTPLETVYPMVWQYANVLNSVLMKDFIRRLGRFYNFVILIFGVLLVRFVSVCFKPLRALTAAIVILLLYTAAAVAVFNIWGLWIDLFYPVFAFTLVYTASTLGRVLSEMRKRQLMETELKIASQIQNSFLPEKPPSQEGLSLSVFMKPAKQVGGDVYEFVQLPDERLGVMVGDVTGKGTPAALFMAKTVSQFKFIARDNPDPADVLTRLNNTVAAESRSALFVTLSYVIFDLKNKKLLMSNGGHLPLVTESGDGHMALLTTEEGLPIGVMEGTTFSKSEYPIKSGDCFVLYSDGISEARNLKEEEYGVKALQQQINDRRQGTADAILKQTIEHVTRFIGKAEQHDDMTLIVVKIN